MGEQPEKQERTEPMAPYVLEEDQTVPPRPEEELADVERTERAGPTGD